MTLSLTRDHSIMNGRNSEFDPPMSFDGMLLFVHSSDACCADVTRFQIDIILSMFTDITCGSRTHRHSDQLSGSRAIASVSKARKGEQRQAYFMGVVWVDCKCSDGAVVWCDDIDNRRILNRAIINRQRGAVDVMLI